MANRRGKLESMTDFLFLGSKITVDIDKWHESKRWLLPGRKAMTNIDNVLKRKDITLLTKIHIVKAMVFPVVVYGREWSEVKVTQLCLTLCNPKDCSLSGPSTHGLFQARILEWVAIPFSRGSSQPRDWTQVSNIAGRFFSIWITKEALWIKVLYMDVRVGS